MPTFTFHFANNLNQFHAEVIAAIPDCAPSPGRDGELEARVAVEGRNDLVRVTPPDSVTEAQIQAVVDAHVPDPTYGVEVVPTLEEFKAMASSDRLDTIYSRLFPGEP